MWREISDGKIDLKANPISLFSFVPFI